MRGVIALALGYGLLEDALGGSGIGLMSASMVMGIFGSHHASLDLGDVQMGLARLGFGDTRASDSHQAVGEASPGCVEYRPGRVPA